MSLGRLIFSSAWFLFFVSSWFQPVEILWHLDIIGKPKIATESD